jgi:hypothetical protein
MKQVSAALCRRGLPDAPSVAPTEVSTEEEARGCRHGPVSRHQVGSKVDEREPHQAEDRPEEVHRGWRRRSRAGIESVAHETQVAVETFELIHGQNLLLL